MAINAFSYQIIKHAMLSGALPRDASIIEFGEANWYGDVPSITLFDDINALVEDDKERERLLEVWRAVEAADANVKSFALAKVFYGFAYGCRRLVSVDLGGTTSALRHDLNTPLGIDEQFDIAINNGTAEHIFDIAQFFRTMHERTRPGGLMIHEAPFTGWIDHGFYSLQPTLFFDLAAANDYRLVLMVYCRFEDGQTGQIKEPSDVRELGKRLNGLSGDSNLFVMLRKGLEEKPFRLPMQGYYDGRLSEKDREAWKNRGKS